jgi:hypothetical protein
LQGVFDAARKDNCLAVSRQLSVRVNWAHTERSCLQWTLRRKDFAGDENAAVSKFANRGHLNQVIEGRL